jgi:hypothetical protein
VNGAQTIDKNALTRQRHPVMKQRKSSSRKKPLDYPEETEGSRMAAEIRKRANKLTREQRRELFRRGMVMIYGGEPKEATRPGH